MTAKFDPESWEVGLLAFAKVQGEIAQQGRLVGPGLRRGKLLTVKW